jgi:hypothetical protein
MRRQGFASPPNDSKPAANRPPGKVRHLAARRCGTTVFHHSLMSVNAMPYSRLFLAWGWLAGQSRVGDRPVALLAAAHPA